jgi:hypothetical protein
MFTTKADAPRLSFDGDTLSLKMSAYIGNCPQLRAKRSPALAHAIDLRFAWRR